MHRASKCRRSKDRGICSPVSTERIRSSSAEAQISYDAALSSLCSSFAWGAGYGWFGVVCSGVSGSACLSPCPDSCQSASGGPARGAQRSHGDAAGALDAGPREPIIGGSQGGAGYVPALRWRAGRVGVAYRGGVAAAATATLIYACRDRRPVLRRMVPLTPDESRVSVHRSDGDRSCSGERPGTPPARAGAAVLPGGCRGGCAARGDWHRGSAGHLGPDEPGQLAGDRGGRLRAAFPPLIMRRYLPCSRRCAFHDRAMVSGAAPSWRRRRVTPIAGWKR